MRKEIIDKIHLLVSMSDTPNNYEMLQEELLLLEKRIEVQKDKVRALKKGISENDFQNDIITKLESQLTDLEKRVLELKKNDFNYKEIADILEKEPKAIDNALQRIKNKLKNIMRES